jgi:predicted O-methyltransferase YrrM
MAKIKEILKNASFALFDVAQRFGFFILPVHYYVPLASTRQLRATKEFWNHPIDMSCLPMSDTGQQKILAEWFKPFEPEYRRNRTYLEAVQQRSGPGYGYIEAQALHGFIRRTRPTRVLEIGSGVSTACMLAALRANEAQHGKRFEMTCIEPNPYPWLAKAPVRLIPKPVEQTDLSVFDQLEAGDLLFIDSSHAVRPCGDVSKIYLEVLPRLKSGVNVHIHDIYIPYAFGRDVDQSYLQWMETALLISTLAHSKRYNVLLCMSYMHYVDPASLRNAFPEYRPQPNDHGLQAGALETEHHFPSSTYLVVN